MRRCQCFCLLVVLLCAAVGCRQLPVTGSLPPAAAAHYRQHGDAASLRRVTEELNLGMPRVTVRQLLGPPTYSPCDQQDYYSADAYDGDRRTLTLVVNFRALDADHAERLEWFFLDYIGE